MVAGQLEEGPILLLPSTGTPSDNVLAEFKRLGMTQGKTMKEGFTIGGTGAVSDDTLKAAVKSFAEGLKDQPEAPAASSATPTTTNGAADIVTASGTTTFTIKGVAGASWAITGGNAKLTLDKTSGTFADTTPVTITVTGSGLTLSLIHI